MILPDSLVGRQIAKNVGLLMVMTAHVN